MTTDQPRINADMETARLHLLAEIHAEQQVQTKLLREILDERMPKPSVAYEEVWDDSVPPGGFICSICRFPVESEPCADHAPEPQEAPCDH